MSIQLSPVIPARTRGDGGAFSVKSLDLDKLTRRVSPVVVLDDFRVSGQPFGPHPHAGFSAITYVLEDSAGGLRNRDSLGNDIVVGGGGIVWTQAGSGVIHEETPADPGRELHGLQVFVNLSSKNKLAPPRVLALDASEVPQWLSPAGDRVRVVVGSFEEVASPLLPVEPFDFLEVDLLSEISFGLRRAHNALIYVLSGAMFVRANGHAQKVTREEAIALFGGRGGHVTIAASSLARFVVLVGAEISEPVVSRGPFIMNEQSQIDSAFARYRRGDMGRLAPRSQSRAQISASRGPLERNQGNGGDRR